MIESRKLVHSDKVLNYVLFGQFSISDSGHVSAHITNIAKVAMNYHLQPRRGFIFQQLMQPSFPISAIPVGCFLPHQKNPGTKVMSGIHRTRVARVQR